MFRKFIFIFFCLTFLSSCNENPRNLLKRSASNKLLDTTGFKGEKRRPIYNTKYISQAKRNIASEQDSSEGDEDLDESDFKVPSKVYKHMYMEMLADEYNRKKEKLKDHSAGKGSSLFQASRKVKEVPVPDNTALQQEMAEIKAMLRQTKSDLVRYRCKPDNDRAELEEVRELPRAKHTDEIINPREDVLNVPNSECKPPIPNNTIKQNTILQRKFLRDEDKTPAFQTNQIVPEKVNNNREEILQPPTKQEQIIQKKIIKPEDFYNI